jgi:hypothetical protein
MLITDIEPTDTQSDNRVMGIIRDLFDGTSEDLNKPKKDGDTSVEKYNSKPRGSDSYLIGFVCLVVFVSLAIETPTRFPDVNKIYLYIITSLLAGFIVWLFQKKFS